ncbi:MAG: glycosyltransferase family 2 protein [bacterium]
MDLSIVVINLNGKSLLDACLASIKSSVHRISYEVLVVDNGSRDGSPAMVKAKHPWVRLLVNRVNVGFTRANNQGLSRAKGRYALILNNDTVIRPQAFDRAVEFMDRETNVGAMGLKLLNPDGSIQYSCRRFPSFKTALFNRYSLLTRLFPNNVWSREYLMSDFGHKELRDVDWVSGACLMVRREVMEKIGLLDERFFIYNEDVDWCMRIHQAGWRVVFFPDSEVVHFIGQDTNKIPFQSIYTRHRSMYLFYKKHYRINFLVDWVTLLGVSLRCGALMLGAVARWTFMPWARRRDPQTSVTGS